MKLKHIQVGLSLILLFALLAACGGGGGAGLEEKPDLLRVWITWGDNPAQIQGLFDKFTEKYDIPVEVTAPVDDDSKVIAALSSSEPPDVLVLGGPDSVGSWVREGLVTDLAGVIEENKIDMEDMFEAPLGQCKYDGKYYCLPWGTDAYALYWNKDLFEDAGLDPEKPPETLEQLVEYADKLTKKDADGNLTQIGFIPDFSWSHFDLYSAMFGGSWYNKDGTEITFTSDAVVNAMLWEQQFYTKNDPQQVLSFMSAMGGYNSPDQGFYAGKIAMMVEGEWQVGPNFISKYKPELNYGVAAFPYPASNPERKNTVVVAGTVALIPSGVKNPQASGLLLSWMMSPEILAEEMVANFNLPTTKEAAKDPRFLENKRFVLFMDLMANPNATTLVYTAINAEVNDSLGNIETEVLQTGAEPLPLLEPAEQLLQASLDEVLQE